MLNAAFLRVGDTWSLAALVPTEPPTDEEEVQAAIVLERDPKAAGIVVAKAGPKASSDAAGGVGAGLWGAECLLRLEKRWFKNVAENEYELDELNQQPLMQALLRAIDGLRRRGLEGCEAANGMPLWMHHLRLKFDAPALLKAGDSLQLETDGRVTHRSSDGKITTVVPWGKLRPLNVPLTVTLQGVMGRWGEFIDLGQTVHPPLPPLVRPGDTLRVAKDAAGPDEFLLHVSSGQKLQRTDDPRVPLGEAGNDLAPVPPHAATAAGATMTLPQGASFVNPPCAVLLLNPSQTAPQVQLLIAKLVLNRQALFRPHVRHWARPLLQLVFDSLTDPQRAGADGSHCLHYLARDLLTLVCAWPADALQLAADPTAATLVSDDLCILEKDDYGTWRLTAAAVTAPTYWSLFEAMDGTIDELHEPVPDGSPLLSSRVNRIFAGLAPGRILERFNWTVQAGGARFTPERPLALGAEPEDLFLRVERQTVRKLPETGAICFTIRVCLDPLLPILTNDDLRECFEDAWIGADRAIRAYKGWDEMETLVREACLQSAATG